MPYDQPSSTVVDPKQATLDYFHGDQLAADVFDKYRLTTPEGVALEMTPDDMHDRIAHEFARIERSFGGDGVLHFGQIRARLNHFKWIIPQGSPMAGIGNDQQVVSLSNCVVVDSPEDSISGIFDKSKELAQLFKRRCGVGIDISTLRPQDAIVRNAARTSSGAWSFAEVYSNTANTIGQQGRRGALMISIDVRHPDVVHFIKMKSKLGKVEGANVSVRISDDFMEAVAFDKQWEMKFPVDDPNAPMYSTIRAKDLWDDLIEQATKHAEPGLLMWDNITKMLPADCYKQFKTVTTNPCGEIPLSPYDSCRLMVLNLKSFVDFPFTKHAQFDREKLQQVVREATRLSDDLVQLELEKIDAIIESTDDLEEIKLWNKLYKAALEGRRIGLGTTGVADMLACLGLRYDCQEAVDFIDSVFYDIKVAAYRESVQLSRERGSFPVWNWETEKHCEFFLDMPADLISDMIKYGRRNISILTLAPTGSVSIEAQVSSGGEPNFRNQGWRFRKMGYEEPSTPDRIDHAGVRWKKYRTYHRNVQQWRDLNPDKDLPEYFVESDQIDWQMRIKMQSAMQKHIDHSISSTINLPKGTTTDTVSELYLQAWSQDLKGVTVYVEGSRQGVLVSDEQMASTTHSKRPKILTADVFYPTILGEQWLLVVGLLEGKPYELFCGRINGTEQLHNMPRTIESAQVERKGQGRYDLELVNQKGTVIIEGFNLHLELPEQASLNRMISTALRHNVPIQFVVEQIGKSEGDFQSLSKVLARYLKRYIVDGLTREGKECPECHSDLGLVYQEGCLTCQSCGFAKCG